MDCSLPGSSVHGILQARILEWVAILFSRDLPDLEIKPGSPALQEDSLPSEPPGKPSHDISCHSENWPQRNGNKMVLELKTNCTEDNQDDSDQTTTWPISR